MIVPSASHRQRRAPAGVPEALTVSAAVRGYDGDNRCGDVAFVLGLDPGRTAIVVIDVAGHGESRTQLSAILAEEITTSLRRCASPADALTSAEERLRTIEDDTPYAVAFVAIVHEAMRLVVYASAGHDVAFALASDGRLRHIGTTGPILGLPHAERARNSVFFLDVRDTLVIVTDGISESCYGSASFFGATGTARAVSGALHAVDPALAVIEAARAHGGGRLRDDAGVIVVGFAAR